MAHQADRILTEQPFARAIDQDQAVLVVEGEDGHVDLGHDGTEQGRGFLCAQALHAERLGQRVDLEHHVRERIAARRLARTHGEVALAHRREQIRDGLERPRHAIAHDDGQRDPGADGEDERRDADQHRVLPEPEQRDGQRDRGQRRRQRQNVTRRRA